MNIPLGTVSALFGRGYARIGIGLGIFTILTFAKVWQDTFEHFGIPIIAVILAIPIGLVLFCVIIGYIEKMHGIWGTELRYTWAIAGYDPIKMADDMEEVKKTLEILKERQSETKD